MRVIFSTMTSSPHLNKVLLFSFLVVIDISIIILHSEPDDFGFIALRISYIIKLELLAYVLNFVVTIKYIISSNKGNVIFFSR